MKQKTYIGSGTVVHVPVKAYGGRAHIRRGEGIAKRKFAREYEWSGKALSCGYDGSDDEKDVYLYKFRIEAAL